MNTNNHEAHPNTTRPHLMEMEVQSTAFVPKYAHSTDAGMDLKAAHNDVIKKGVVAAVGTGIKVAIPEGFVGLVSPRSGLAKKGVTVANAPGIVDSGYRGEVKVLLTNFFDEDYRVERGDRIAQLVIVPVLQPEVEVVSSLDHDTDRGSKGFGSTGV